MTKKKVIVKDEELGENLFRATLVIGTGAGVRLEDKEFYPDTAINQLCLLGNKFFDEAKDLQEFSKRFGDELSMGSPNFAWKLSRVSALMMSMYTCAMRMVLVGGKEVNEKYLIKFFLLNGLKDKFIGSDELIRFMAESIRIERSGGEALTKGKLVSVLLSEVVKLTKK